MSAILINARHSVRRVVDFTSIASFTTALDLLVVATAPPSIQRSLGASL